MEKIIVLIASFHKRIDNWIPVLDYLLKQSLSPDKIILNLCIQNFPKMENDFPKEIKDYLNYHKDIIEIYWYIEDYLFWKKHLHTIDIASDDDIIITVDDDRIFSNNIIEKMYLSYLHYGKKYPVTFDTDLIANAFFVNTGFMGLYQKTHWNQYKKFLYNSFVDKIDDFFIDALFTKNNYPLMPIIFAENKEIKLKSNDAYTENFDNCNIDIVNNLKNKRFSESRDWVNNVFEERYFKNLNLKRTLFPARWSLSEQLFNWLKTNYIESEPIIDYLIKNFTNNFLVPQYKITDNLYLNRHLEDNRLIKTNAKRINIIYFLKRNDNILLDNILNTDVMPDYIILYISRKDFNIPKDAVPTQYEISRYISPEIADFIDKNKYFKLRYFDESLADFTEENRYNLVETQSEIFDKNIFL